ncbi:MAG TPA: hypothetical protein VH415_01595 [Nitrososphaeraceae archaeon]|jgi:hypothetical protein
MLVGFYFSVVIPNYQSYAQKSSPLTTETVPTNINNIITSSSTKLDTVGTSVGKVPKIKILSPQDGQKVTITDDNLVVFGTSSDDRLKDCKVSVLLNGIRPYQNTLATGKYGANDYSTWKYKLEPNYTVLKEGPNKLTAKVACHNIPYDLNKWTSIALTGSKEEVHRNTTSGTKPLPLGVSIKIDKNPISVGDIQTITVKVLDPDSKNSETRGTKVHGEILDLLLFPPSSYSSKNLNAVVEQFDSNTDRNGEVSYSWKVPENTPIGTPYIVKVDALSDKYSGRSASDIFTVKPSNSDNVFILAQASRNFTNGLNDNIKNFTQEIFNEVKSSLKKNL